MYIEIETQFELQKGYAIIMIFILALLIEIEAIIDIFLELKETQHQIQLFINTDLITIIVKILFLFQIGLASEQHIQIEV